MRDVASTVRRLLDAAVAARVTPGAIVEAGSRAGASLVVAVGGLTYDGLAGSTASASLALAAGTHRIYGRVYDRDGGFTQYTAARPGCTCSRPTPSRRMPARPSPIRTPVIPAE